MRNDRLRDLQEGLVLITQRNGDLIFSRLNHGCKHSSAFMPLKLPFHDGYSPVSSPITPDESRTTSHCRYFGCLITVGQGLSRCPRTKPARHDKKAPPLAIVRTK